MLEGTAWEGVGRDLPIEVVATIVTTQTGRLRLAEAVNRGLNWSVGDRLGVRRTALTLRDGRPLPALAVTPVGPGDEVRMTLNAELRVTLPQVEREFLGIDDHGDEVLVAFHLGELDRAVLVGTGGLSALLVEVWPEPA